MRKSLTLIVLSLLAISMVFASGTEEVGNQDITMVTQSFAQNNITGTGLGTGDNLLEGMKEELGIGLNFIISNGTDEQQQMLFRIGALPETEEDLFYILQSMADDRIVNYLEPLNKYLEEKPLDGFPEDYSEGMLADFTIDGNLYAIPIRSGVWNIWYNQRILEERGITELPSTPEEIYEIAKACTYTLPSGEKVYGFASRGTRWDLHEQLAIGARMFGGDIITPDYEVVINEEPVIKFLELYRKMYAEGLMPPNWNNMTGNDADQMLKDGRAALSLGSANYSPRYNNPETSREAGNILPCEIPLAAELQTEDKKYSDSISFTWAISILKGSDQKDLAWDVIRYLTSDYASVELAKNENAPARMSVLDWQAESGDAGALVASATFPRTRSALPPLENSGEIIDIIGEHMENVVIKGMDAQTEMDIAASKIEALI